MNAIFPAAKTPGLTVAGKTFSAKAAASLDQLIVLIPQRCPARVWRRLPEGERVRKLAARRAPDATPNVQTQLRNKRQTGLQLARIKTGASTFDVSDTARKLAQATLSERPRSIGVLIRGFDDEVTDHYASLVAEAILINNFRLPNYASSRKHRPASGVRIYEVGKGFDVDRVVASAKANSLARWLAGLPPNILNAASYRKAAEDLATEHGWKSKFHSVTALEKLGAGAFLAVAQGNANRDAGILHLRYTPESSPSSKMLSLVGKGIIFDTGGNNLKPFKGMLDMHIDMQGSAVALATLMALSELRVPFAVDCWLAISENRIGPAAYKSQDLIRAMNGKSIQTIHTDAEGRLVLADTLTLATREPVDLVIDFATLTGACVTAITSRYSGVFTNRPALHPLLKRAGERSGERVWPFPVTSEFTAELKSDVADLKQCTEDGSGDHILAACFLKEFVSRNVPWVHVDLSAAAHKGGLGLVGSELTGFGVRYALALLLDPGDSILQQLDND